MKHLLALLLLLLPLRAGAQRLGLGTDAADWLSLGTLNAEASLGTLNAEASLAASRHLSLHAGVELNPWTFHAGKPRQMELRQNSWWAGVRWWPWHVYAGWWAGADGRYTVYNVGGGFFGQQAEEGDAGALSLWGGYAVMLSPRWNLDLGAGIRGGWTVYKVYACPQCGRMVEQGVKPFLLPDARIALQLLF